MPMPEPKVRPPRTLAADEIRQFQNDGVLVLRNVLPASRWATLQQELVDRVENAIRDAVVQGVLSAAQSFSEAGFASRLALASASCADPLWIWRRHFSNLKPVTRGMFELRTAPELLSIVGSLIGPELFAHPQYALRTKLPDHAESALPWHQDIGYLEAAEARNTQIVNCWVPLVSTTKDNGCMQVLVGSHQLGVFAHSKVRDTERLNKGIPAVDLPDLPAIECEVEPGDVVLLDESIVHRSLPNRTNTVRWSVDTRYSRIGLPTGRARVPGFIAQSHDNPGTVTGSWEMWAHSLAAAGVDANGNRY